MDQNVVMAIAGFLSAFVFQKAWDFIAKKNSNESERLNLGLEKNTEAIIALQMAILELKVKIEHFAEKLTPIPKIVSDVGEAHSKIRELKSQIQGIGNGT